MRPLVAEVGRDVPDLPRGRRLVLGERPGDGCGAVGAQREVASALVGEVVELLAHRIGAGPELLHHLDVLEDRRDDQLEGLAQGVAEAVVELTPLAEVVHRRSLSSWSRSGGRRLPIDFVKRRAIYGKKFGEGKSIVSGP